MNSDSAVFAAIWGWFKTHTPDVLGVFLATVIGALRSAYTGEGWRRVLLEGALCGAICMTIDSSLDYVSAYLHIPGAPSFVGGMIGFVGVERIRALILRRFDKPISKGD